MSSYQQQSGPPPGIPPGRPWEYPPRPPGMSTGSKVLIGLGIGCGVVCLMCCGGLIALVFFFQQYFETAFNEDPQEVRRMTERLVDIEVPGPLQPKLSVDFNVPLAGIPVAQGVVYAGPGESTLLMLVEFGDVVPPEQRPEMQRAIEQALREQGAFEHDRPAWDWETQVLRYRVNEQPASFRYETATDPNSGRKHVRVAGSFPGKVSGVEMILLADTSILSEEQILSMLDSLGEPLDEEAPGLELQQPDGEAPEAAADGEPPAQDEPATKNPNQKSPPADAKPTDDQKETTQPGDERPAPSFA